jgi:resuscitation-promoting factor RpfB
MKKLIKFPNKPSTPAPPNLPKHPFVVPVLTFLFLFITACLGLIFTSGGTLAADDTKLVKVHVDGKNYTFPTHAPTVGELLKRLNIELYDQDLVEPNINSPILSDNFSVNVYRARPVTVVDENGDKTKAKIADSTPRGLVKKAGYKVHPEDNVDFAPPDQAVKQGIVGDLITIDRAVPVQFSLYGKTVLLRTHAKTVGDLLDEKGVQTIEGDSVQPSVGTPIKANMKIFVLRKGQKVITVEEKIPAPVETEYDATMKAGETKIVDPGQDGQRIVTYEIKTVNGREVSRKELHSIISTKPEVRKVIAGTKTVGFEGGFASALAALRSCEGSYTSNTGNGYYGAYQFDIGTWGGYGGYSNASQAPPAVQDQKARDTYVARGWSPWPSCSQSLGLQDIYR